MVGTRCAASLFVVRIRCGRDDTPFKEKGMAYKESIVALAMIIAASPVSAALPAPIGDANPPAESPNARYCLRVDPTTGSRMETIQCRTREEWAQLDVDVDKEWEDNGVRVIA
jgi:hypothetical protein